MPAPGSLATPAAMPATKPVVKFVPKSISLFGEIHTRSLVILSCAQLLGAVVAVLLNYGGRMPDGEYDIRLFPEGKSLRSRNAMTTRHWWMCRCLQIQWSSAGIDTGQTSHGGSNLLAIHLMMWCCVRCIAAAWRRHQTPYVALHRGRWCTCAGRLLAGCSAGDTDRAHLSAAGKRHL